MSNAARDGERMNVVLQFPDGRIAGRVAQRNRQMGGASLHDVRGGVPYPSVRNYFMLNGEVGYIGLVGGFQGTTSDELDQAIAGAFGEERTRLERLRDAAGDVSKGVLISVLSNLGRVHGIEI